MRLPFVLGTVLWVPVLRSALGGGIDPAAAAVRLGMAVGLAWVACAVVTRLGRSYAVTAPEGEQRPVRRHDDVADDAVEVPA